MRLHPDAGGSHDDMIQLNEALHAALNHVTDVGTVTTDGQGVTSHQGIQSFVSRDISCFTVDLLPVDSWHLLSIGASHLGAIIDEEEPYLIDFQLSDSGFDHLRNVLCRCEIVPEAGGSTIHVSLFSEAQLNGSVELVRDLLVQAINDITD